VARRAGRVSETALRRNGIGPLRLSLAGWAKVPSARGGRMALRVSCAGQTPRAASTCVRRRHWGRSRRAGPGAALRPGVRALLVGVCLRRRCPAMLQHAVPAATRVRV